MHSFWERIRGIFVCWCSSKSRYFRFRRLTNSSGDVFFFIAMSLYSLHVRVYFHICMCIWMNGFLFLFISWFSVTSNSSGFFFERGIGEVWRVRTRTILVSQGRDADTHILWFVYLNKFFGFMWWDSILEWFWLWRSRVKE